MKDTTWRWVGWLMLGIGALVVAGGVALGMSSRSLALHGVHAEAEIVELRLISRMHAPILRFRTADGQTREVKDIAVASPGVAVGDKLKIVYRAADPDDFQIDSFDRLWMPVLFITGFGCVWLAAAFVVWAIARRLRAA